MALKINAANSSVTRFMDWRDEEQMGSVLDPMDQEGTSLSHFSNRS